MQIHCHMQLLPWHLTKNRPIIVYCPMPKNKQAYIRYRIIDACLRNKQMPFPNKEELIKACEVIGSISLRTIEQDLYDMQHDEELGYFAPIKYDKKQKGYCYEDGNYSISNIPLKEHDFYALEFAVALLKQFEGIDTVNQFSEAVAKIEDYVNVRSVISEESLSTVIQLEQGTSTRGQQFLNLILQAIKETTAIHLQYKKFDSAAPKSYTLHPYVLKEYRNRWYVTGFSESTQTIITLGLDRIVEIEKLPQLFKINNSFNAAEYFKYSFGISVSNHLKPEAIVFFCNPQQAAYIKSQPLHHTQTILSESALGCTFSIEVIPSFELKAQLLSYGKSVKVLKPDWLHQEMIAEYQEALEQYR